MRSIAIIGAGQAGLLLGIGLLGKGYRVTIVSDRTAEEIRHGTIPAGVVVFDPALQIERDLGISFWDGVARPAPGVHIDVFGPDGRIALSIASDFRKPALSVDQRLKFSHWLQEFERRGGHIIVKPATMDDLDGYAHDNDLVVVAVGKKDLSQLFAKNQEQSPFQTPPRHIAVIAVTGHKAWANGTSGVRFIIMPGVGEMFSAPFYTKDEIQGIFLGFEPIPGGPLDRFRHGMSPPECLDTAKQLYRDFVPWEDETLRDVALADARAAMAGAILPCVRRPVGHLPSGACVMGIGDTVILNDPIAAQGANNAARMARLVKQRIVEHGDRPFDAAWMTAVFDEFWTFARHANRLNEILLLPPAPHVLEIMGAAAHSPAIAADFIHGFVDPPSLFPALVDPDAAKRYLQSKMTT